MALYGNLFYFDCQEFRFWFVTFFVAIMHFADNTSLVYLLQYIEEIKSMSQNQMLNIVCALCVTLFGILRVDADSSQSTPHMFD